MVLLSSAPISSTDNLTARRRPLARRRRATREERLHSAVTEALEPRVLLSATHLAFAIQPTDTTAGAGLGTVTVDVEDGSNTIVAGDTSLVTFSINTGPAGAQPIAFAVQAVAGVATISGLSFQVAGTYTLHAVDGSLTAANSNSFTINPDVATHLAITAGPAGTTAGATISSVTVAVEDQYNNVVTSDTSNVSLGIASGPGSPGFSGTTPVAAVAGVATFSDLSITKVGSYTFSVADTGLTGDTSGSFAISPDVASQLVLTQGPSSTTAGLTLNTITANVEDQYGNVVTTDTSAVTIAVHTGSGTLTGTKTVNAVAGVATFGGLSITTADTYVLRLSDSSLATADTSSITISPDVATHLAITQGPTTTVAGQSISDILVEVRDQYDNVVTTDSSNVTIALATGTGTLSGTKTVAASSGIATFTGLSMTVAGNKTFTISDSGLTGATTGSTTISPDTANHLAITTAPANTPAGQTMAGVVVAVEDQFGNIETGDSSNVTLAINTGTGVLNGTLTAAAVSGVATFSTLSIDQTGAFTLEASDNLLTVADSGSFTITPALADHLTITQGPTTTVAGQTVSTILVEVRDAFGNVVTTDNSNVTIALNTGTGTLSGTTTVAAVSGVATFSTLSITTAGAKTFAVTDPGLTGATTGSFSITPDSASQLVLGQGPSTTTAGLTLDTQTVSIEDQYGNVETSDNATSIVASIGSGGGVLNGTTTETVTGGVATFSDINITNAGAHTLHFADAGITADTATFTINADVTTHLFIDVAPTSGAAGGLATIFVSLRDQYGNTVNTDRSTITLGVASGPGTLLGTTMAAGNGGGAAVFDSVDLDQAGNYTLFVSDGALTGATSGSFTISAAAASQVVLTTQPTDTVAGVTVSNIVAKIEDQFGNVVTTDTSNVTIGVATGTGSLGGTKTVAAVAGVATFSTLSMTTTGSKTFTVSDSSLTSATTSSISITPSTATQLVFTTEPSDGTVGALGSVVVKVEDVYGNVVNTDTSEVDLALNGGGALLGTASVDAINGVATFSDLAVHESGEYTLTAMDTGLTDGNSSIFDLDPDAPTQLAIDTQPVSSNAGDTLTSIVLVEDQYGNLVTSDSSQITVALGSGNATIGGTKTVDVSNGAAIFSDLSMTKAGDYTFHFTDGNLTATDSNQFTISPGSADHLAITTGPTTTVAGQTISGIDVQVEDIYGNLVDTDTSDVTIAIASGPGTLASGTTTQTAVSGVATFGDLVIDKSGSYTLTVTDSGITLATSGSFSITPDIAAKVVFTAPPASGTVGGLNAIVAKVEDQFNNVVTTNTSSVTLAIASGSGALLGTTSVNAVAGVATFSSVAIHTADSYTLSAADTGLTGATSGSFTLSPDAPSKLIITQQPTTTVAGQTISDILVEVRDQYDNVVTTDGSNVTIALATGTGTVSGTKTVAASSGIATFSGLSMTVAGDKTFTITENGLTSATTSTTTISPDSADHLSITAGPTRGSAGALNTITVAVEDQFDNIVISDSSTVLIAMNSGGGTLLGTASVAAINGVATFNALSVHTPGTFTLAASDGGLTAVTSGSFTISPATASQVVFTTQPGNISAGALGTVIAKVEDQFGNVVTTDSSTVALSISGSGALLGTTSATAASGIATFNAVTIHTAGTFTLGASDASLTAGTSNSFTVSPTAATHLAFTSQPSSMVAGNLLTGINASIEDQYNNVVTSSNANITFNVTGGGSTFNFVIAAVNGVATLNSIYLVKAGSYGVNATSPGVTQAGSNVITVTPDVASQILITTEPATTVAGQTISNIVVTVEDQFNNTVTTDSSSVTLAINSGPGTLGGTATLNATAGVATFSGVSITTTGAYTLSAADAGLTGDTSGSFNITPGSASHLVLTTQPTDTVAGQTISNVVAKVEDQYGNVVTGDTSNVTIAISTGTGLLSGTKTVAAVAGVATFSTLSITTSGNKTLTVTDNGLTSATTNSIAISPDIATKVVFTTQPASAAAGALNTVIAKVEDQYGNVVNTDTSEVDLAIGSGSGSLLGTATANAVAGVATFSTLGIHTPDTYTLTASDTGLTGDTSGSFTISPAAPSQLVITTEPTDTTAGQTISNTVVKVEDQWGNVVTTDTSAVTIAIATGSGTLAGTKTLNAVAGVATFSTLSINQAAAFTFSLTDSGLTPATTSSITVSPDIASKLVITTGPTTTVAGQTISSIAVSVEDQFGNVVTTDSSNVAIAIASGPGTFAAGTATANASTGIATFGDLQINTSGNYTLSVSENGLTGATSGTFSITAATASKVVFTTQPATGTVGNLNTVVAKVEDQYNNVVTTNTSTVSLAIASGSGSLLGTASVNAVAGIATFNSLAIHTADSYTLSASDTGLTGDTSGSFTLSPGAATQLAITQQPGNAVAGTLLSTIKVSVEDQYGNVVTTDSSNVNLTLNSGGNSVSLIVGAVSGVASFSGVGLLHTGTFTFHAIDGSLTAANSNSFIISPDVPAQLAFTTGPTGGAAGAIANIGVSVEDQYGNVVTNSTATIMISVATGAGAILGTTFQQPSSGVATFSNLGITVPDTYTLDVASTGLTGATSSSFTITPAAPAQLVISTGPTTTVAGQTISSVVVKVEDQWGNIVTNDSSNVTIAIATGAGSLAGTKTVAAVNGVATFSTLSMNTAGSLTLDVTDGALTGATTSSFSITPAAASQLVITNPTTTVAGQTISNVIATIEDQFGNVITSDNAGVTIAIGSGPAATLNGTTTVNAVTGIATFSNLNITKSGNYTFDATSAGVTAATSGSFTVSSDVATHLAFGTQPSSGAAGALGSFTVDVLDQYGNIVTGDVSAVSLSVTAGSGSLLGTASVNAVAGIATFSAAAIDVADSYTLTASDGSLTQDTSSGFTISPAAPTHLVITTGPSNAVAGQPISSVVAKIEDQYGNVVTSDNASVTLALASGPSATLNGTTTVNAVAGIATFSNLNLTKSGSYTFDTTSAGITGATSSSMTISPATASMLAITTGPTTTVAGNTISSVVVAVEDQYGNVVITDASNVAIAIASGPGTFAAGTATANASSGIATFGDLQINTAGSYTLSVSENGLTGSTSGGFSITPAAATKVVFTTLPAAGTVGALNTVVAQVEDQYNNVVTTNTSTVSLAIASGSGSLLGTASANAVAGIATFNSLAIHTADTYTLSAADTGLTSDTSASFMLSPGAATHLVITTGPTATVAGNDISAVIVAVEDQYNNVVTSDASMVTIALASGTASLSGNLTAIASSGVATFNTLSLTKAGTYTLGVADSSLTGDTSGSFNITPDVANHLLITGEPGNTIAGQTISTVTASIEDQYGNIVTNATANVSITLTDDAVVLHGTNSVAPVNGVATFSTLSINNAGNGYVLRAFDGGLTPNNSTTFNVTHSTASKLVITQGATTTVAGQTISDVIAQVEDTYGNVVNNDASSVTIALGTGSATLSGTTTVTAVNGIATFSGLSLTKTGSYTLHTSENGLTGDTTGSFNITPAAESQLIVSNATTAVAGDTIAPITVTALDQYGNVVTSIDDSVTVSGEIPGITGTFTQAYVNGVATFSDLSITAAGTYTFTAADNTLSTNVTNGITITPATPSQLVLITQPSTAVAGQTIGNVVVDVEDQYGNVVTNDSSSVSIAITTGAGLLAGTQSVNAVHGIATFSTLSITVADDYTFDITDNNLTDAPTDDITITPAAPSQLVIVTEPGTQVGKSLSAMTVAVEDQYGNVVTTDSSNVTVAIATGSASLGGTLTEAAVNGIAEFDDLAIAKNGTYSLSASDSSLTSDTSDPFTIGAKLVFQKQPAATTAGVTLGAASFKVFIEDANGHVLTNENSTVSLAVTTGPGDLQGTVSVDAVNGVATFTDLSLDVNGTYKITASDDNFTDTTSVAFAVAPAAPAQMVALQDASSTTAGVKMGPAVRVQLLDAMGNIAINNHATIVATIASGPSGATVGGTVRAVVTNGIATFSNLILTKAGTYTLQLAGAGLSFTTVSFNVTAAAAKKLGFVQQPTTATTNTNLSPSVTVAVEDAYGNIINNSTASITLAVQTGPTGSFTPITVTAVSGTATFTGVNFTKKGTYKLKASSLALTLAASSAFAITLPVGGTH